MGEKRSNVFQTLSRKHHHVKTYLHPVVRVYKTKTIKEVESLLVSSIKHIILF